MNKFLTTKQAAQMCGLSHVYIRKLCQRGVIKATKLGKTWVIDGSEIKCLIERKVAGTKKAAF